MQEKRLGSGLSDEQPSERHSALFHMRGKSKALKPRSVQSSPKDQLIFNRLEMGITREFCKGGIYNYLLFINFGLFIYFGCPKITNCNHCLVVVV